jgi:excisionase family DNA binding protein
MTTQLEPATATKRSQLLKVSDVAQLLNVKPRTIYEMVARDRIPYRKPPGSNILRFDLDEIVAWTKAKTADDIDRFQGRLNEKSMLIDSPPVVYWQRPWLHLGKGP